MPNDTNIKALKIGLKCQSPSNSPALTLLYEINGKKRNRVMPIKFLNDTGSVEFVAKTLIEGHKEYLRNVPITRIEKLLKILLETKKGREINKAAEIVNEMYKIDPEEDLNKVTEAILQHKKKIMDENFVKNQVKKGDAGYEYDTRKDFEIKAGDAGWDSDPDSEDFFE